MNRFGFTRFLLVGLAVVLLLYVLRARSAASEPEKSLTDLYTLIDAGKVGKINVSVGHAEFITTDGQKFYTVLQGDPKDLSQYVLNYNHKVLFPQNTAVRPAALPGAPAPTANTLPAVGAVSAGATDNSLQPTPPKGAMPIDYHNEQRGFLDTYQGLIGFIVVPLVLLGGLYVLFMRQAQSSGNQALTFGRARARRLTDSTPKITFEDVAGVDEAKQELEEIVEFLRNRKKFEALGAKVPKGVLLLGPPGCGKTMLARAIAGEADVPFWHISGSDFVEMFVGVGASRVRDLFETAKASAPSLIFIDEIDAVGRQRGAGLGGGHDEREQTLNQLLVEMDGFDPNKGVILVAATNRPDILDPALTRPGRFDRRVTVDNPDLSGRKAILGVHVKGKPLDPEVDIEVLAKRTPGFSGADLANLVNEAALLAARKEQTRIEMVDFDESIDRVLAGPERRSRIITDTEKHTTAIHEAGHAIVARLCPGATAVHKVSIVSRGMALGYTVTLPTEDKHNYSRQELLDRITYLLGGRAAEQSIFNEFNTGASQDLDYCADIARSMVCDYGMSEKLGPVVLGRRGRSPFLGRDFSEDRNYSEDVAKAIDEEVRRIITECYERAVRIVKEYRQALDEVVKVLLEKETINAEEFEAIFENNRPGGLMTPIPDPELVPA